MNFSVCANLHKTVVPIAEKGFGIIHREDSLYGAKCMGCFDKYIFSYCFFLLEV